MNKFEALKRQLKDGGGVQVVTAPLLYETPTEVAQDVVMLADILDDEKVLEPSAGTGRLVEAIRYFDKIEVCMVEVNPTLCHELKRRFDYPFFDVICEDFLSLVPDEKFDKIIMNPPFNGGSDIKHVKHALKFLKDGGRLVAIVANGPRQQKALQPLATDWHELPRGTFKNAGTMVNTAIVVIDK